MLPLVTRDVTKITRRVTFPSCLVFFLECRRRGRGQAGPQGPRTPRPLPALHRQEWGQADDYHLVVSSDLLGIEETAEAIFRIVGRKRDEAAAVQA